MFNWVGVWWTWWPVHAVNGLSLKILLHNPGPMWSSIVVHQDKVRTSSPSIRSYYVMQDFISVPHTGETAILYDVWCLPITDPPPYRSCSATVASQYLSSAVCVGPLRDTCSHDLSAGSVSTPLKSHCGWLRIEPPLVSGSGVPEASPLPLTIPGHPNGVYTAFSAFWNESWIFSKHKNFLNCNTEASQSTKTS